MKRKCLAMIILVFLTCSGLWAEIHEVKTHIPAVPGFLESVFFRTVESMVLPSEASGMVSDPFGDLAWNPAFVLRPEKKILYLDYGMNGLSPSILLEKISPALGASTKIPNSLHSSPMYGLLQPVSETPTINVAVILPLSKRMSLGIINKTVVDKQPFLEAWHHSDWGTEYIQNESSFEANTQDCTGIQSELTLGYRISKTMDLGLRAGYYRYSRNGDYLAPRKLNTDNSDIDATTTLTLDMPGEQFDLGLGVMIHIGPSTHLGISGGVTKGETTESTDYDENRNQFDEASSQSGSNQRNLELSASSEGTFKSKGTRKYFTLTFERHLSSKWTLRSFFSYSGYSVDSAGGIFSLDMEEKNYISTYTIPNFNYQFLTHHVEHERFMLVGTGTHNATSLKWFASADYHPSNTWKFFGGIQIRHNSLDQEFQERSNFRELYLRQESGADSESEQTDWQKDQSYMVDGEYREWLISLPLGMKVALTDRLDLLIGTDLTLTISRSDLTGEERFNKTIYQKWYNDNLQTQKESNGNTHQYRELSPSTLNKQIRYNLGLTYHAAKGLDLYLHSYCNIFDTANWSFGLMYRW